MADEKITVVTENGKKLEVVVASMSEEAIWVVLGEGLHSAKCKLAPTRTGAAYAGSVMGREIVYEQSVASVKAACDKRHQVENMRFKRRP